MDFIFVSFGKILHWTLVVVIGGFCLWLLFVLFTLPDRSESPPNPNAKFWTSPWLWAFFLILCVLFFDAWKDKRADAAMRQALEPVVEEYLAIARDCAPSQEWAGPPRPIHRGKVVIIDGNNKRVHTPKGLVARDLFATSPEEARTLVVFDTTEEKVFSYDGKLIRLDGSSTSDTPVYCVNLRVRIIDLKTKVSLATLTISNRQVVNSYPEKASVSSLQATQDVLWYSIDAEGHRSRRIEILRRNNGEPYGITDSESWMSLDEKATTWVKDCWDETEISN